MSGLKIFAFLFALKNLLVPSFREKKYSGFYFERNGYRVERIGQMADSIRESSGLEIAKAGETCWTHGDGGCQRRLYEVDKQGKALSELSLPDIRNHDWEELAKDDKGNLYICDVGNNANKRRDLRIYKIDTHEKNKIDTIFFVYPDQKAFPPSRKQKNFDCEAVFWHKDSLYLFSKNRGTKWMKMYCLPDKGGHYVAKIQQKIFISGMITSADISPDNHLVALLSYGKIYFLKVSEQENSFRLIPWFVRAFNAGGQSEALVFLNDTDLLVSNESGQLFRIYWKKQK